MLVTDDKDEMCGDNYKMLVTVFVINIMDPLSSDIRVGHQYSKDVAKIHKSSPSLGHQQHDVININVTQFNSSTEKSSR